MNPEREGGSARIDDTAHNGLDSTRFARLSGCRRVWAIAAIRAQAPQLRAVHTRLAQRLQPRDGLVYLGNMLGYGNDVGDTVRELLSFRAEFLSRLHAFPTDVAFLRGAHEEMLQKLLELQFAPSPGSVLDWMVNHGLGPTLEAYGASGREGFACCRDGALAITRWTTKLRSAIRRAEGHATLMAAVRRAAYTRGHELLFVSAGLDPHRALANQGDRLWWGTAGFMELPEPYGDFRRVVRGQDPRHSGLRLGANTASIDQGAGFGGKLTAACFDLAGELVDNIQA